MKRLLLTSIIFFSFFVYGLITSQYTPAIIEKELKPENPAGFYDYKGVTHVHSIRSTGSGSHFEVISAAQEAGLDFLFFTDMNDFSENPDVDGYHRKLLVSTAAEYSYLDSRMLLYDSKKRSNLQGLGQAQVLLADLLSQKRADDKDGIVVLAHPFKSGYSWSGAYPLGLDGIEVINLKSVWQKAWRRSKPSFVWSALIYAFNPQLALLRLYLEPTEELKLWDELNVTRHVIGLSGSDSTAKTSPIGGLFLRFPSYASSFSISTNHVLLRSELTGNADRDREKIVEALVRGHFYMSLDLVADPKGFIAYLKEDGRIHPMGSEVKWREGMKLFVALPEKPDVPFETVFLKDGVHVMSSNSKETNFTLHGPGVYRVVVRVIPTLPLPDGKKWISWIYSNPFRVK